MTNQQLPATEQQRNLKIIITKDLKSGSSKQRKVAKQPIEYSDSLPTILSTRTEKCCCHSTNLFSVHTWNMQYNSGPLIYNET